ncbi:lipopolysaccharide heptosyltransferase I [Hydrogenimonas sp. SS33]|uniref:lipopolysaccharide heptosyltransferase I n=1 Tax=Hydrogenimonas leucolamina TaxID=2954236 RepID=UPI00336C2F3F
MRLAIVRLTAMGDVIHTLASMQFVKKACSHCHITWFVEEKFAPVLRNNPDVDAIIPLNLHGLKKGFSLGKTAEIYRKIKEAGPFDKIIDVQGLIKSALVARIAGGEVSGLDRRSAREGVASLFYRRTFGVDCAGIAPMRFASLIAQSLDMEITEAMMQAKRPYLFSEKTKETDTIAAMFDAKRKNILIITGASNASKTYPEERWVETIAKLKAHRILLVAGSEEERKTAREIASETGALLLPAMSLNALKYAVGRSDLLIGGDTGPSHMAWAMNRPSLLLFGSTPKTMMMETPVNVALTSGAKVHPCRFDKSDRSIAAINPESVAQTAQRLLA